jgi:hypothetical protein
LVFLIAQSDFELS